MTTLRWLDMVVGIGALAFATSLTHGQTPVTPAPAAALVNGEAIRVAEVQAVLEARPSSVPLTAAQKRELRQAALDMLIDDLLMRQFLRQHGGPVPPGAIDKEITDLQAILKKDNKTLEQVLRDGKQTEEQFRADIASRLQWRHYLRNRYPDQEIKTYYDANKVFFDKVFVRASHILVKVRANAPAAEKQAARARLETLRQEIVSGKLPFEEAAQKYSDCPSKDKHGDIGPFPFKFVVVEPFAKAAFAMKVGDVSGVVTSDFGLHVIKVTERTPGEPSSFEAIKDQIREVLAQEMDWYQHVLADQRKASKIEVVGP